MKKSMHGTRDAASNWERDREEHVRDWGFQLGTQLEDSVSLPREASVGRV